MGPDHVFQNSPKTRWVIVHLSGFATQDDHFNRRGLAFRRGLYSFILQVSGIFGVTGAEHNRSSFKLRVLINFKLKM